MSDLVAQLESWYSARCTAGDGNHHGFQIQNVAEGGWWIRADLPAGEIGRFELALQPREGSRDEAPNDWIDYSVRDGAFIGACAPRQLHELLLVFLSAASAAQRDEA